MKIRFIMSLLAFTLSSATSFADVPFAFSANTKAKASEVNANFTALDTRLDTVESKVDALATQVSGTATNTIHQISYAPQFRNVGEQFTLGGVNYAMFRFPFVEYRTNTRYAITLPVALNENGYDRRYAYVYTNHNNASFNSNLNIAGYPASIEYLSDTRYFNVFGDSQKINFAVTQQANHTLRIKIDDTIIISTWPYLTKELQRNDNLAATQFDLVPLAQWPNYVHPDQELIILDTLLDYIRIEKLP